MKVAYNPDARADLARLQKQLVRRIVDKVHWFAEQLDPLHFAVPVKGTRGFFRFRVGDYRVVFTPNKEEIVVLLVVAIKHRNIVYR